DGIRDYKVTGVQTCALPIYFLPDAAESDQAERAAEQAACLAVCRLVPAAGLEVRGVGGDTAVQRQDECKGQFGDGAGVLARAVRSEERRVGKEWGGWGGRGA